jgi:hypothetical protein
VWLRDRKPKEQNIIPQQSSSLSRRLLRNNTLSATCRARKIHVLSQPLRAQYLQCIPLITTTTPQAGENHIRYSHPTKYFNTRALI